jgi:DNA-binding response OmpR family regulator
MTLLGERTFDIVLLDLALSDKNGMDLLGEIHMLNPLQPGS